MSERAERWLPVPDWPGYEVSDLGRVRSVDRRVAGGRIAGGVELRPAVDRDGYLRVTLRDGARSRTAGVHVLVKFAFTGPARGRQVRHLNDVPGDNRLVNLRYGTRRQNAADKDRNRGRRNERTRMGTGEGERGTGEEEEYGKGVIGRNNWGSCPSTVVTTCNGLNASEVGHSS